jgi:hypothetical protein
MEDSPQAPLLPLARRETRNGHSRFAATRSLTTVESAQSFGHKFELFIDRR